MTDRSPTAPGREDKAVGTQAIRRALAVLRTFQEAKSDLGIAQIAAAVGLRPSTAHRIVRALVDEGYVTQNEDTDRYYLGRSTVLLGLAAHRNLGLSAAFPVLERLGASTSESANMGVPDDKHALVVLRVESPLPLRFDQPPGTRVPLHASSMGKSILAFGDGVDAYLDRVGGTLHGFTPATITSADALRKEIETTRTRGYSIDHEESIDGVRCVGAPILNAAGQARGAIAIQAPAIRMPDSRIDALTDEVLTAAKEIAELLPTEHEF